MASSLTKLSEQQRVAVVVTNHVTTRLGSGDKSASSSSSNSTQAYLAPALGESWSHAATNRVELFWDRTRRTARLTKSPSLSLRSVRVDSFIVHFSFYFFTIDVFYLLECRFILLCWLIRWLFPCIDGIHVLQYQLYSWLGAVSNCCGWCAWHLLFCQWESKQGKE